MNRLEDVRDVARAQLLCRDWRDAGINVQSLRITCLDSYHERARNDDSYQGKSFKWYGAGASTSGSRPQSFKKFRDVIVEILESKHFIVQLRIEVEAKLQSKSVPELCIVDYGQQAIMRRPKIVKILSETCKGLKSLDLRNLFIDTSDCMPMPAMTSLALRCVSDTLQHTNDIMSKLQTLSLLGVFGAEEGFLEFQKMKVLCLGLSTPAKDVVMICAKLEKLQLKMQCPEKLIIKAENLKYVAFNLDVMQDSEVELRSLVGLQELLYGASSFFTLASLVEKNHKNLGKIFLDVPCMALAEDGTFLGVLKDVTLQLPSFRRLHQCEKLEVLNIGPGLWHSMETKVPELLLVEKWPSMKSLILHMIPHNMEAAIKVLEMLLRPSVTSLVVFVHESSPMTQELMAPHNMEPAIKVFHFLSTFSKSKMACFFALLWACQPTLASASRYVRDEAPPSESSDQWSVKDILTIVGSGVVIILSVVSVVVAIVMCCRRDRPSKENSSIRLEEGRGHSCGTTMYHLNFYNTGSREASTHAD